MAFLLDTDVAVHLRDGDPGIGRRIADLIAAQALVHRATLVTMNADDFKDVPGLQMLIW